MIGSVPSTKSDRVHWMRGASLIVLAIAEGCRAAAGVDKYLRAGKSAKKSVA